MTEAEWLACDDPRQMLDFVRGKTGERKMRLLAAACCRRRLGICASCWPAEGDGERVLAVSERYADGTASAEELRVATDLARTVASGFYHDSIQEAVNAVAQALELRAPLKTFAAEPPGLNPVEAAREVVEQTAFSHRDLSEVAALLRELLGNPIRPAVVSPGWMTQAVRSLAETVAAAVDFTPLPILADALEDAGCTERTILEHCRGPGPHVRGCWVVDLILGKQ
jgi:hypothetical protein